VKRERASPVLLQSTMMSLILMMKRQKTANVLCARDASRSKVTGYPLRMSPPSFPKYRMTKVAVKCETWVWFPVLGGWLQNFLFSIGFLLMLFSICKTCGSQQHCKSQNYSCILIFQYIMFLYKATSYITGHTVFLNCLFYFLSLVIQAGREILFEFEKHVLW
jgi:hypothetical protein